MAETYYNLLCLLADIMQVPDVKRIIKKKLLGNNITKQM